MNPGHFLLASVVAGLAVLGLAACGGHDHHDHDHHDHADHAHDHDHDHDHEGGGHTHAHTAPHGGALIAFGDEFAHLELVLDSAEGKLTGYILDGEAEQSVRLQQDMIELSISAGIPNTSDLWLTPVENSLTGETVGDTSVFSVQMDSLKNISSFKGSVKSVTIKGQTFDEVEFSYPEGNH